MASLCLMVSFKAYSQKQHHVVDSWDKKPIEFVSIISSNGKGIYSDENGFFSISCVGSDSLFISRVGYEAIRIHCESVKDTILMKPINNLKEVIIKTRKNKQKTKTEWIGFLDYKSKGYLTNINQVALFITNHFNEPKKVNYIKFNFSKIRFSGPTGRMKNVEIIVRLRIYGVDKKGFPSNDILNDNIIANLREKQKSIIFNIENKDIEMPVNGFFIAVEFIGYANEEKYIGSDNSNFNKLLQFAPVFSKGHSFANSWYKKNHTSDWKKLISNQSSQSNFNFGVEVQIN